MEPTGNWNEPEPGTWYQPGTRNQPGTWNPEPNPARGTRNPAPCDRTDNMSFYLTTAIDYVNSRPHLGTAYEKIDGRRHRALSSGCAGVDTRFLMGNDEHSQNVFKQRARAGRGSARLLRPDGAGVPRRLGSACDISFDDFIRTTEPRHTRGGAAAGRRPAVRHGDIYEGIYEGWYCVGCEAFKQEKDLVDGKCPIHLTQAGVDPREELLLPAVEVPAAAARSLRRAPGVHRARDPPQRDPAASSKRGLEDISVSRAGQSWGIPLPFDPEQRRLRLVRRAHQLRVGGRLRHRRGAVRARGGRPTCTSSARTSRASTA